MRETCITFYLRTNGIHIHLETLRSIGCPKRICLLMDQSGRYLLVTPYVKRDFKSHKVPEDVYKGTGTLVISSKKLCEIIAQLHHWNPNLSYCVYGKKQGESKTIKYDLTKAQSIHSHWFEN